MEAATALREAVEGSAGVDVLKGALERAERAAVSKLQVRTAKARLAARQPVAHPPLVARRWGAARSGVWGLRLDEALSSRDRGDAPLEG